MSSRDPFYVGYLPEAPAELAGFLRLRIAGLLIVVAILGVWIAAAQDPFASKRFEWTEESTLRGRIEMHPVPQLVVDRPARAGTRAEVSRYPLVAPGKFGAAELVGAFDGETVELSAHLIYREDQTMLELVPGSVRAVASSVPSASTGPVELGPWTLQGEIVDSKCYLGVMNPGDTKAHRSCAIRCISGGIPPVLLLRQDDGTALYLLLVGPSGESVNQEVLPLVAEAVEVSGRVLRYDELLVLRADPSSIRRVSR